MNLPEGSQVIRQALGSLLVFVVVAPRGLFVVERSGLEAAMLWGSRSRSPMASSGFMLPVRIR